MKAKDIRTKNTKELIKELKDKNKELEKLMLNVYKGKEKNLGAPRFLRKDIARIKTVLAEKKFMEESKNA